jgi:RimJ/RimL family protein N-acetyltransferase
MTGFPPIRTPRLLLRDFVEGDWPAVQEYAGEERAVRFTAWGPNSAEGSRDFIRKAIQSRAEIQKAAHGSPSSH